MTLLLCPVIMKSWLDNCKELNFTYFWSLFHIRCWLQLPLLNLNLYSWWV